MNRRTHLWGSISLFFGGIGLMIGGFSLEVTFVGVAGIALMLIAAISALIALVRPEPKSAQIPNSPESSGLAPTEVTTGEIHRRNDTLLSAVIALFATWLLMDYLLGPLFVALDIPVAWWEYILTFLVLFGSAAGGMARQRAHANIAYGTPSTNTSVFCPNCGVALDSSAKFCAGCGTKLS